MRQPRTPGVYIEEISSLPPSVSQVASAIPAFIGFTNKIPDNESLVPLKIDSMLRYEESFGTARPHQYQVELAETTSSIGYEVTSFGEDESAKLDLFFHCLRLFYTNGGGECYIIPLGEGDLYEDGIEVARSIDEITILVCPEVANRLTAVKYESVCQKLLSQCGDLKDRFAVMDVRIDDVDASEFRNMSLTNLKYGAAYLPYLKSSFNYIIEPAAIQVNGMEEFPDGISLEKLELTHSDLANFILYEIRNNSFVDLPPSAAIAGIYAKVDRERGVWKAPANVSLSSVTGLTHDINHQEQESLNVDPIGGKSINAIRKFAGKGILVWGARTLAGNDNEWRYISVRRFFNMVEESVKKATESFVFEPNDRNTWVKVKSMIDNYLTQLWRDGALAGAKPEDAFFAKIGLGQTMTPQDILEGRMIVEIGMAVVRPAEFIILRFAHKMQES